MNRKHFFKALTGVAIAQAWSAPNAHANVASDSNVRNYGAKGDGKTDDTGAFQKCLREHGEAYVPKGVFIVNNLELDGAHLFGLGTLKMSSAQYCVLVKGKGARIEGLRFQSVNSKAKSEIRLVEGASEVLIHSCHFEGKVYSALAADENTESDSKLTYKSLVKRVSFNQNFVTGYVCPLYLHSVEQLNIEGNFFSESFYDAIRIRQACERVVISHNQFENVGTSTELVSRDAVDCFWSGRELIITGNIIKRPGHIGLDLKGVEPQGRYHTQHVMVANNYIEASLYASILLSSGGVPTKGALQSAGPFVVQGNIIVNGNRAKKSEHDAAIWIHHGVSHAQILNNQISGHLGHGISVTNAYKGASQTSMIQIAQNMLSNCHYEGKASGVFWQNIKGLMLTGNMIEGCDQAMNCEKIPDEKAFVSWVQIEGNWLNGEIGTGIGTNLKSLVLSKNKLVGK